MDSLAQKAPLLEIELAFAHQRIAALEVIIAQDQAIAQDLARLATFPEQNPNSVIETNLQGKVTYMNPDARAQFPDLWEQGFAHPLLRGLDAITAHFLEGHHEYVTREVDLGEKVYEMKICFLPKEALIHIYAHNVTARKRAEEEVKGLASQLRLLTRQIVQAQEEERRRVAHELHDEAGQALVALKISLGLLQDDLPPNAENLNANLAEAIALIDETRNRIRLIARGLRPPELDTVGLPLALEAFCREFSRRTHLNVRYSGEDIPPLSETVSISLYRFLQEALTNVASHANATEVRVGLSISNQLLQLSVEDNGKGLDHAPYLHDASAGLGLLGMKERLELLNGWLDIQSRPGWGTCLVANIPWNVIR